MNQIENLKLWYDSLQARERILVIAVSIIIPVTVFYVLVWEPVFTGLEKQKELYNTQKSTLAWMQQASLEVKALQRAGKGSNVKNTNQPLSIIIEQTAESAGLKKNLSKLESSGQSGAQAVLELASFDQMLIWLNTLQMQYNVNVSSANIDRTDSQGAINARISFTR